MEVIDCSRAMIHVVEKFNENLNYVNLGSKDTCSVSRIAEIVIETSGFLDANIEFTGGIVAGQEMSQGHARCNEIKSKWI